MAVLGCVLPSLSRRSRFLPTSPTPSRRIRGRGQIGMVARPRIFRRLRRRRRLLLLPCQFVGRCPNHAIRQSIGGTSSNHEQPTVWISGGGGGERRTRQRNDRTANYFPLLRRKVTETNERKSNLRLGDRGRLSSRHSAQASARARSRRFLVTLGCSMIVSLGITRMTLGGHRAFARSPTSGVRTT